jgi:hypothetical protein
MLFHVLSQTFSLRKVDGGLVGFYSPVHHCQNAKFPSLGHTGATKKRRLSSLLGVLPPIAPKAYNSVSSLLKGLSMVMK